MDKQKYRDLAKQASDKSGMNISFVGFDGPYFMFQRKVFVSYESHALNGDITPSKTTDKWKAPGTQRYLGIDLLEEDLEIDNFITMLENGLTRTRGFDYD